MATVNDKKKKRLIVKHGNENIILSVMDIALLYVDSKTVFVIDQFSKKYLFQKSLSEVEKDLDEKIFFRANRQMIVNIHYIKGFIVAECNKLNVLLSVPCVVPQIIISQETAPFFKKWVCES
ncbi:MAG: LytTR family DNA-binding domain-containing protein [Ginsengibacter sp.]